MKTTTVQEAVLMVPEATSNTLTLHESAISRLKTMLANDEIRASLGALYRHDLMTPENVKEELGRRGVSDGAARSVAMLPTGILRSIVKSRS